MNAATKWSKIHAQRRANRRAKKAGRPYPRGAKGCPKCEALARRK